MKPKVIPSLACLFFASAYGADAPPISSIDVAMLETGLQSQPLDEWLAQELGEEWEIVPGKELTDCGEQIGVPGRNDFPLCIEIKLVNGSELGYLNIAVGTYEAGVAGSPHFFFGVMQGRYFNKLSELKSSEGR